MMFYFLQLARRLWCPKQHLFFHVGLCSLWATCWSNAWSPPSRYHSALWSLVTWKLTFLFLSKHTESADPHCKVVPQIKPLTPPISRAPHTHFPLKAVVFLPQSYLKISHTMGAFDNVYIGSAIRVITMDSLLNFFMYYTMIEVSSPWTPSKSFTFFCPPKYIPFLSLSH